MAPSPDSRILTAEDRQDLGAFLDCLLMHMSYRCTIEKLRTNLNVLSLTLRMWEGCVPQRGRRITHAEKADLLEDVKFASDCFIEFERILTFLVHGSTEPYSRGASLGALAADIAQMGAMLGRRISGPWAATEPDYNHDMRNKIVGPLALVRNISFLRANEPIDNWIEPDDIARAIQRMQEIHELLTQAQSELGPDTDRYHEELQATVANSPYRDGIAPWLDRLVAEGAARGTINIDVDSYREASTRGEPGDDREPWVNGVTTRFRLLGGPLPGDSLYEWLVREVAPGVVATYLSGHARGDAPPPVADVERAAARHERVARMLRKWLDAAARAEGR